MVTHERDRLRVRPWRGDASLAQVTPPPGRPVSVGILARCLDELVRAGYTGVLTSALAPDEQEPFLEAGFSERERLVLLRHDLRNLPQRASSGHVDAIGAVRLRRATHRDEAAALAVDARAFDDFWRFDRLGLAEARSATPASRWRVAVSRRRVLGYAVTGRSGRVAYLQRLAVDPVAHGLGIGTRLVIDALTWASRRGAHRLLVNTQEDNGRALALYLDLGFTQEPVGLVVLHHPLDGRSR